ncbi:hypothetical protein ACFYXJ_33610 [Streptomyces sp. NPDC002667]|uniref:hypothetical protein n=1 Tax=Streptomyces sp. NPDC002667 TaxID=3364657 RepID=UPI0036C1D984
MTTPNSTVPPVSSDGTSDIPPIWFTVPDGFFALPVAPTPDERDTLAQTFVRELYSRGDESLWAPAAPYYAAIAEYMADEGVSYAAMGLFATEEDGVAQCSFTVAAVKTDQTDPDIAAQGTLAILAADPLNDARWLDLPCGPAVSCVTLREFTLQPDVTATGEESKLLTGEIQVHVPFSTGPYTAIFTLYTASTEYWSEFCDLLVAVLRTVSFVEPADGTGTVGGSP